MMRAGTWCWGSLVHPCLELKLHDYPMKGARYLNVRVGME